MDTEMATASGSPMVFSSCVFFLPMVASIALLASFPAVAASEIFLMDSANDSSIISSNRLYKLAIKEGLTAHYTTARFEV